MAFGRVLEEELDFPSCSFEETPLNDGRWIARSLVFRGSSPQAQPLLLIHGANSGPVFWLPVVKKLLPAGNYEIHCLALPGFGLTVVDNLQKFLSLSSKQMKEELVEFVHSYIRKRFQEQQPQPVVVGHSFGGFIAAQIDPGLCKHLVLINPAGLFPIFGAHTVFWGAIFYWGLPNSLFRRFGRFLRCLGDVVVSKFVDFTGWTARWKHPVFGALMTASTPTTFVWGENDAIIPKELGLFATQCMRRAQLKLIRNCGHSPTKEEHFQAIADAVLAAAASADQHHPMGREAAAAKEAIDKLLEISEPAVICPRRTIQRREKMFQSLLQWITKKE